MSNRLDNNADGTSQESPTSVAPAQDVTDSAKDPDMDDWRKTFGHNIPVAVKEFLKNRHREWELEMEADLMARQKARAARTQKL